MRLTRLVTAACVLFGFLASPSDAQTPENTQKEINDQVWKPFIQYFNAHDQEGFASVHSKDMMRVQQDGNRILGPAEYFKMPSEAEKARFAERKVFLELRFIKRFTENGRAF